MRRLTTALDRAGTAGEPLPPTSEALEMLGARIRLGQLTLVCGAPGAGKSLWAMNTAARAGVPTLYGAYDMDAYTTGVRMAAMHSASTIQEVEARAPRPGTLAPQDLLALRGYDKNIRWDFANSPSIEDVEESVRDFAVAWGDYPHLLVVDGLRNLFLDGNEYDAMRVHMERLAILARETESAVVVLHHLLGEWEGAEGPPPMKAIEGKVSKFPSLILNLYRGKYGDVGVAVVKNRFGPADPSGRMNGYLLSDMERARVA